MFSRNLNVCVSVKRVLFREWSNRPLLFKVTTCETSGPWFRGETGYRGEPQSLDEWTDKDGSTISGKIPGIMK